MNFPPIPLGYGVFCATFDFTVTYYILTSASGWREQGQFDPFFWRQLGQ